MDMDNQEEKDALWQLLGRAKPVEASPWFTQKVMRQVRAEAAPKPSWSLGMVLRWLVPTSAFAALALAFTLNQRGGDQSVADFNEQFDQAADLQSLVAFDNSSVWTDDNQAQF